ncbi:hypothetical protein SUGI_1525020 [Cryptomeria japonica]|uniref:Uncharacterized protein n=1 Tax=Cryptomeria japonica TaxID=3369 RepID=A0AAD3NVG5_CRYJA|nr:hypothetical protein SUGI_1525020 [Cryptomeria japonica]
MASRDVDMWKGNGWCRVRDGFSFLSHPYDGSLIGDDRVGTRDIGLEEGKWMCVGVFRQGCRLMDLGYKLTATTELCSGEGEASRGLFVLGEEARVLEAFTNLWALFM